MNKSHMMNTSKLVVSLGGHMNHECLYGRRLWLFMSVAIIVCGAEAVFETMEVGTVLIDEKYHMAETSRHFICATLDLWPSTKCLLPHLAFSPLRLRIGGTLQDRLIYQASSLSPCPPFTFNTSSLFNYTDACLSMERWDQLNSFIKRARVLPTFGLNALYGKVIGPHHNGTSPSNPINATGSWDPSNAESFIRYTHRVKDYTIYGWELGNELGGVPVEGVVVDPDQYAADAARLHKLLSDIYVTKRATDSPPVMVPGGVFDYNWFKRYIANDTRPPGVITHHTYPLGSGYDENLREKILNATVLDEGAQVFKDLQELIRKAPTRTVSWIGESGGVFNSGRDGITNTFLFSFWYLDHMAMAATYDTKVYCRQTLTGGNYALLDTNTSIPNPDYYSALLWHRLMGRHVLSTTFRGTKNLRAYAHCAKQSEGITVLLINLDGKAIVEAKVEPIATVYTLGRNEWLYREEYHLSPEGGDLQSRTVLLNDKPLLVDPSHDAIPELAPKLVPYSEPVTVNPHTIVFVHLARCVIPACQYEGVGSADDM